MESFLLFLSTPIGKIIAASSVVAALITSVASLLNARSTNNRILEIEKTRQSGEIASFRYTKLFELMQEFNSVPAVIYDLENIKKLAEDSTTRYHSIEKIFERAEPLLDVNQSSEVLMAKKEAKQLSNKMVEQLHGNGEEVSLKDLLQKRQDFDQLAKMAISSGIKALTISSSGQ